MTLWVVQRPNVTGEEARQVLNEIDFNRVEILLLNAHLKADLTIQRAVSF